MDGGRAVGSSVGRGGGDRSGFPRPGAAVPAALTLDDSQRRGRTVQGGARARSRCARRPLVVTSTAADWPIARPQPWLPALPTSPSDVRAVQFLLREPAVGAGDEVLASHTRGKPKEPFRDELRMFDDVGPVAHDARHEDLAGGSLTSCHTFHSCSWRGLAASMRYAPAFTLRIRSTIFRAARRWYVARPATPAHVVADAILGNTFERVVENVDVPGEPRVVLVEGPRRHHPVVRHRGPGVVHLQQETGIDNRAVLRP